jgi:PAS domain S-box-containing protein
VLRERHLGVPLIIVSATIAPEVAVGAMRQGAADYIPKDRLARLGPAVAVAIERRRLRKAGEQTCEALENSNSLLNATLESTTDGILVVDSQRHVASFNQKFLDMWRIPADLAARRNDRELLGYGMDQLEDPEAFLARVEELYRSPQDCSWGELRFRDGRCFERYSQPQRLGGAIVGRVWSFRDITERKLAEENHARLATAVEQAHESIVITDVGGNIQYVNPFFERVSGYTKEEVIGRNPRILKSCRHDEEFFRAMWGALARGETWRGRITNKRKDGALYEEEATISPILDAAGKTVSYVAVKRDVTREVELEAQFIQAQKMEAVGQLAGGVAHDFNNILTMILMQTELVSMVKNIPEKVREGLRDIAAYADRAGSLTRQLLLFSRRQAMQPRDVDWNELVRSLVQMLHRVIGEDVRLQLNLYPGHLMTHADPGMLDQVLLNLVVNARDAMPGGGHLRIETGRTVFTPEQAAAIPDASPGEKVCLRVSDTGLGIAPENLARIFEPFFTTKELGKGTGLGLASVFGIVKQHGGVLSVESEQGRGSTFQIFLPASGKAGKSTDESSAALKSTRGTETILFVEDEEGVRLLTRTMLERAGYKVLEASLVDEAARIWEKEKDSIHLLLVDMVMPHGLSGREFAAWVQARKPDVRIVFTSGYSVDGVARQLSLKQGHNFVRKPFSSQQLLETVRHRLDH